MKLSLPQMRALATGALIFCAVGMTICRWFEPQLPLLAWFRAALEAATVGALADWFAVVVLFRHPLGIPIPHTAILPKNKERVAEALAHFIETSFLTPDQLRPRMESMNFVGLGAAWLRQNAKALSEKALAFAPGILEVLNNQAIAALLSDRARDLILKTEAAPLAGEALETIIQGGRDREIFESSLRAVSGLIAENRAVILDKIRQEIPIGEDLLRGIPTLRDLAGPFLNEVREIIARKVADKTVEKVQSALDEAAAKPDHPLWQSFHARLRALINDLKSSPEMAAKVRSMQEKLSSSQLVEDFASRAWSELKEFILADCTKPESLIRQNLLRAIQAAAEQLEQRPELATNFNAFLTEELLKAAIHARPNVRELIITTIARWDAQKMAERLEGVVGRDLQFIRLNGTLVGGMVGLAIHTIFWLANLLAGRS